MEKNTKSTRPTQVRKMYLCSNKIISDEKNLIIGNKTKKFMHIYDGMKLKRKAK
jgi:hypothetical protein